MKFMYQLSTNAVFCSETELKYDSKGKSLVVNGLFSITGNEDKYKRIESFSLYADQVVCSWKE